MKLFLFSVLLTSVELVVSQEWSVFDNYNDEWSETIERDVCIIGGGASGVHAAVSLQELNKTVVVVERNSYLGGHAHTYQESGLSVDIGVVVFQPIPEVLSFFQKFNVSLLNLNSPEASGNQPGQPANKSLPAISYSTFSEVRDFRDGSIVIPTAPSAEDVGAAFAKFTEVLEQYEYLLNGYDLPDPVPEDLYIPFGAFIKKYNLEAAFPEIFRFSQGMGDLLHVSTIYAIKYFNLDDIKFAFSTGYLTPAHNGTKALYDKAAASIGPSNILLESTIMSTNRQNTSTGNPELLVSTKQGLKLLSCTQILLTIPPTLTNLRGWDLTPEEEAVFSQYTTSNGYWAGLVKNLGLNQTIAIENSAAKTPFNIPVLPSLYALKPVGILDDVWEVKFGANNPTMTTEQVKSYIEREIATLQTVNNVPVTVPEWLLVDSHTPFHLQVSAEAIKTGFFKELTGLQGGLGGRMFFSGAAFHSQHSSLLWRMNKEVVIPLMLKSA